MINKRDISKPRTTDDIEMRYQLSQINQIPNKVDKEAGKGLSTNNFSNRYKNDVEKNTKARHTHNNASLLNSLTEIDLEKWNKATSDTIFTLYDDASSGNVELENSNYDLFIIFYGNDIYIDSKIIIDTDKQFYLSLENDGETIKEFYTLSNNIIQKESDTNNITIYKVIGYMKGE